MAATSASTSSGRPSPRSALTGVTSPPSSSSSAAARRAASVVRFTASALFRTATYGSACGGDRLGDVAVAATRRLGGVQHEQRGVDLAQGGVDRGLHLARERIEGPLKAGQVEQHELVGVGGHDPADAPPRGLGMVGHDAHLVAHEPVDQSRFADVGPAEHGHEPGTELGRAHRGTGPWPGNRKGVERRSRSATTRSSTAGAAASAVSVSVPCAPLWEQPGADAGEAAITLRSPNSASACRHTPQGGSAAPSRSPRPGR